MAVLEFSAIGATRQHAVAVSDRMRQRFLESGRFRLVERELIDKILAEQAFQQTGCTSQECAVQVGKILGVRKMVTGSVSRVGENDWVLSAAVMDVETAEIQRAASIEHRGDFLTLLGEATARLTIRLIGQSPEGLSEILTAAGVESRPKHSHQGLAIAVGQANLASALFVSGWSYTASLAAPFVNIDYQYGLNEQWTIGAFIRYANRPDTSDFRRTSGDGDTRGADYKLLIMGGVDGRYWWPNGLYVGAGVGATVLTVNVRKPKGDDLRTSLSTDGDVFGSGPLAQIGGGWEGHDGLFVSAEYLYTTPEFEVSVERTTVTDNSSDSFSEVTKSRNVLSGWSIGVGYRF